MTCEYVQVVQDANMFSYACIDAHNCSHALAYVYIFEDWLLYVSVCGCFHTCSRFQDYLENCVHACKILHVFKAAHMIN